MAHPKHEHAPARGVLVALATPYDPDSTDVNAAALLDYMDRVAGAGPDGFVLFGTTGEFVHYSIQERNRALSLAAKRSRIPFFVNVSHSSFAGAMALAESAVEAGTDGVFLMPPYYFRYSDDQIFAFYEAFVRELDGAAPVYLYNIPFFTHAMPAGLLRRLLETGKFAGIKDSSGEWPLFDAVQSVRQTVPLENLVGNDRIYAVARAKGASGIVSGVAAAVPELMVALDRAVIGGDTGKTAQLDTHLREFLDQLDRFPATVVIKQCAAQRGWLKPTSAIPFDVATQSALENVQHWFDAWLPRVITDSAL